MKMIINYIYERRNKNLSFDVAYYFTLVLSVNQVIVIFCMPGGDPYFVYRRRLPAPFPTARSSYTWGRFSKEQYTVM